MAGTEPSLFRQWDWCGLPGSRSTVRIFRMLSRVPSSWDWPSHSLHLTNFSLLVFVSFVFCRLQTRQIPTNICLSQYSGKLFIIHNISLPYETNSPLILMIVNIVDVDGVVGRNGSWFALNLIKFLLSLRSRMQDILGRATDNENYQSQIWTPTRGNYKIPTKIWVLSPLFTLRITTFLISLPFDDINLMISHILKDVWPLL